MKVVILIPIFKRPEVLKLCLSSLDWFISNVKWEVKVVTLLSPDDPNMRENEGIVKKYGHKRIYYKNLPVADKMNAGIEWIVQNLEYDYLMNFGSDDLIHPDIEMLYEPYLKQKLQLFGINTLYFYELGTKKTIFFNTYNTNGSIGAARMIHCSVLREFSRQQYPMYEPGLNAGLDGSSSMSIKRVMGIVDVIIDSGTFPYIVDVKTNTNINHMMHIETRVNNISRCGENYLNLYFPKL